MIEPLNCHCGASAKLEDRHNDDRYQVVCENNHVLAKRIGSTKYAVCLWNNRIREKRSNA